MKTAAWIAVLAVAAPALAHAAPQQAPDGIVTVRKKGATWCFKLVPEGRKKVVVDEKEVDTAVPQRLHAVWVLDEPYAALKGINNNVFSLPSNGDSKVVDFFKEGKEYAEYKADWPTLQSETRQGLSDLQKSMVQEFYQFDLDFPGGSWEELAKQIRDRLAAAYEQQLPEILKPYLPARVEIELSSKPGHFARYPAIQAKSVSLAMLRRFGPGPMVEGKSESIPRMSEREDKSIELVLDVHQSLSRLVLTDGNALGIETLEVAFFHLGSKSTLPGADHVVALFEMAWKARSGPLYAKVKFHPETKTLMVQGTFDELQAADKVFATLTGKQAPIEPSANPFDAITQTLQKIAELIEKQAADKDK